MLALLPWLETLLIAVSSFNTITLLWLGLTVLLNADRRRWGTWVAGGGLVVGGLFFAGHSAAVGRLPGPQYVEFKLWWRIIWLPVVGGPYMWYLVVAWYTGILDDARYRMSLLIVSLLGLAALALPLINNPLPPYRAWLEQPEQALAALGGIPIVVLVYPLYSVLCIGLALAALRRPRASQRFMGDLARDRAQPWLVAASFVLLAASVFVGGAVAWLLLRFQQGLLPILSLRTLSIVRLIDVVVCTLIAVVIVLVGKAVVAYEIFTGKALPRHGLFRYWRNSLILAAAYSALLGWGAHVAIDPIYRLLLATILMACFYALLGWRSYGAYERGMAQLRPFVASQHVYEQLLQPTSPPSSDAAHPFEALCRDVLNAEVAYLVALGPWASFVGPPLAYPAHASPPTTNTNDISRLFASPQVLCVPLRGAQFAGAIWAIPLWSSRGLIGTILLGPKRDARLYTQEEVVIAQATGERLIDTQASTELTRRLISLQRERLVESQVVDRRMRRVLHDDVLPQLHTALLLLSSSSLAADSSSGSGEVAKLLTQTHHDIANLLHTLPATAASDVARLGVVGALRQVIERELGAAFDGVTWQIGEQAQGVSCALPPLTAEVVFYAAREAVRNAARYGRHPQRSLHLLVRVARTSALTVVIEDDGIGLGTTTVASGGSGQGLALHSTMLAVVGGTLTVESMPDTFTRVTLALPH